MARRTLSGPLRALVDQFEKLYIQVGRPALEGRFLALLLGLEAPVSLGDAAAFLGVTKPSLLPIVTAMLERGDIKREEQLPSRKHLYSLTDHAYIRDLRVQVDVSRGIAEACQTLLESAHAPGGDAAKRLANHARVNLQAAQALEGIVVPEEERQNADLRHHLKNNPDALPAKRGRGRKPPSPSAT